MSLEANVWKNCAGFLQQLLVPGELDVGQQRPAATGTSLS